MLVCYVDRSDGSALVHHGVIREDAVEGTEVKMDEPLTVSNRKSLQNSKCGHALLALCLDIFCSY